MGGLKLIFLLLAVEVVTICAMGEVIVRPLMSTVIEHNQLIADCESKLPRAEFCELVALPKVKK